MRYGWPALRRRCDWIRPYPAYSPPIVSPSAPYVLGLSRSSHDASAAEALNHFELSQPARTIFRNLYRTFVDDRIVRGRPFPTAKRNDGSQDAQYAFSDISYSPKSRVPPDVALRTLRQHIDRREKGARDLRVRPPTHEVMIVPHQVYEAAGIIRTLARSFWIV